MKSRHKFPFQLDRPVFVKTTFDARCRSWKKGTEFKWRELGIDTDRVQALYNNGFIFHNPDLEVALTIGDGLEQLDIEGLHSVVDDHNAKVKTKAKTMTEYEAKKCKKSQIPDKQRGLIRSFRRNYGKWIEE